MDEGWLWFALRLAAIIPAFAFVGMLIAINLDLWRARGYLPKSPPVIPWWVMPGLSIKLIVLNAEMAVNMIVVPESVYSRPSWRPFLMLALGVLGVSALRAISRAIDVWLARERNLHALRRELGP